MTLTSLVSHKKSYLVCTKLSNLRILRTIYLFSSSCLCPLLAVSILYFENKLGIGCVNMQRFDTYQIAFLIRNQGLIYCFQCFQEETRKKSLSSFYLLLSLRFCFATQLEWQTTFILPSILIHVNMFTFVNNRISNYQINIYFQI